MIAIIKWVLIVVVVGVVVVAALGGLAIYTALNAEPPEISPEVIAQGRAVEQKLGEAVTDRSAFYVELNDAELSALMMTKASEASDSVRDIEAHIRDGEIDLNGHLNATPAVPFSATVEIDYFAGQFDIELTNVSLGLLPVPGAVKEELQPLIDQGLDINRALSQSGDVQIQSFEMEEGQVTIVGVQRGGQTVSDATRETFLSALGGGGVPDPEPPGADIVPPGTDVSKSGEALYLALGDSLAANVGVSDHHTGYVSRFHAFMEREQGRELGLMNLGVSGENSLSILNEQLPAALLEIMERRDDGDPDTTVAVVTLDLGANDLLTHVGSSDCLDDARGSACQNRINAAMDQFEDNFHDIVEEINGALDSDGEFYIMTMYNPFDFGLGIPFEDFSDGIVEQMNDIIRAEADAVGAKLADPFPLTADTAGAWTNMLSGDIHPNEKGFQALAFSLAEAHGF